MMIINILDQQNHKLTKLSFIKYKNNKSLINKQFFI